MSWPKKIDVRSSWHSLWKPQPGLSTTLPGAEGAHEPARPHPRLEELRLHMLDAVAPPRQLLRHATLVRKLLQARSIEALWYLRSDVMAALAGDHGEAQARRMLDALTALFSGLLPEAAAAARTATGRTASRTEPAR